MERAALEEDVLAHRFDPECWQRLADFTRDLHTAAVAKLQGFSAPEHTDKANKGTSVDSRDGLLMLVENAELSLISVLERAVHQLPGSYKLWRQLLLAKVQWVRRFRADNVDAHGSVIGTFERALRLPSLVGVSSSAAISEKGEDKSNSVAARAAPVSGLLSRMPRLWLDYIEYLRTQQPHLITHTRQVFDAALCSLPPAQHYRVWAEYIDWISKPLTASGRGRIGEGADASDNEELSEASSRKLYVPQAIGKRIFERYLKHDPSQAWEFVEYLKACEDWAAVCRQLLRILLGQSGGGGGGGNSDTDEAGMSADSSGVVAAGDFWWHCAPSALTGEATVDENEGESASAPAILAAIGEYELVGVPEGMTARDIYLELCDVIGRHGGELGFDGSSTKLDVDIDTLIRGGLTRFKGDVGRLWTTLGQYHARRGEFDSARAVFEDGINSVYTARDFELVWEAYTRFEDTLLTAQMALVEDIAGEENYDARAEVELSLERFEHLVERQKLLLNAVWLRQNPHNVAHWLFRARLMEGVLNEFDATEPEDDTEQAMDYWAETRRVLAQRVVATFTEAIEKVDYRRAVRGQPWHLWREFAFWYESQTVQQIAEAASADEPIDDLQSLWSSTRQIFERGVVAPHRNIEDAASMWCCYVEFELRRGDVQRALIVCQRALVRSNDAASESSEIGATRRAYKSNRLWHLLADLEESLGNAHAARTAYEQAITLKCASVKTILSLTQLLQESSPSGAAPQWEQSFAAFERGLQLFAHPPRSVPLWLAYLTSFVECYGGSKIERARELFETAILDFSKAAATSDGTDIHLHARRSTINALKAVLLMYANLEEEYGLTSRALAIYARAANLATNNIWWRGRDSSNVEDAFALYMLYAQRAVELLGLTRVRPVLEEGVAALSPLAPRFAVRLALRFAAAEVELGEIDRARAIFIQASQLADPSAPAERAASNASEEMAELALAKFGPSLWKEWREFEQNHGSEETYREMLRIRRTVAAKFSGGTSATSVVTLGFHAGAVKGAAGTFEKPFGATGEELAQKFDGMSDIEKLEALANQALAEDQHAADLTTPSSGVMGVSFTRATDTLPLANAFDEIPPEQGDGTQSTMAQLEALQEKPVPMAVFERNVPKASDAQDGALARLKRAREQQGRRK